MVAGRSNLSRAISLTIAVTSAFWVALGSWLFHAHIAADHPGSKPTAQASGETSRNGLLGAFGGGSGGERQQLTATRRVAVAPASRGRLAIPVAGIGPDKLIDTFSQARAEGARHHDAIDILATEGTPVLAAAPGRVEKLFLSHDGGQTIYVRSPDRQLIYYYAHLSGYAPGLQEGMSVEQGQVLGLVGHTGNATAEAPHLHFAMWRADPRFGWSQEAPAINPYPLLAGGQSKTSD